jgi:uncharacterized protein
VKNCAIGSSDGNGNADVTPKGEDPGFVAILDDTSIAIPDRPGNKSLDTLENILLNPAVGLIIFARGNPGVAGGEEARALAGCGHIQQ